MTIVFSKHAKQRFKQRAKLNIGAGYKFVKNAMNKEIDPLHYNYVKKYKESQIDPSLNVIAYKHLMFVVRITEEKIFVITVLVIH